MLSTILTTAVLVTSTLAQLPPSYKLAATNVTLGVKYGSVDVKPGQVLPYDAPSQPPTLTSPISLNGSYIAILVDTTFNLSAPIPASLLWFQQDVTFPSPKESLPTTALFNTSSAQVHYLPPSTPGHAYIALLYAQPPGFIIPPDFPYTDNFRKGFNVTRVGVDFKTPLAEANWFVLGSNCTEMPSQSATGASAGLPSATGKAYGYPRRGRWS